MTRIDKKHFKTTYIVSQGFSVSRPRSTSCRRPRRGSEHCSSGIDVSAQPLAYISTDLQTAKLDALAAATAEARQRAEILVKGLGGHLGGDAGELARRVPDHPAQLDGDQRLRCERHSSRLKDVTAVVSATFAVGS